MKKLLLLFAVMLTTVSAWAQVITAVGDAVDPKTFTTGSGGGDHYVVEVIKKKGTDESTLTNTYLYTEDTKGRIKAGELELGSEANYKYVFNIYQIAAATETAQAKFKLWVNHQGVPSFAGNSKGGFDIQSSTAAAECVLLPVEGQENVYMIRGYAEGRAYLKVEGTDVQVTGDGAAKTDEELKETAMWVKIHKTTIKSSALTFDSEKNYYLQERTTGLFVNNTEGKVKLAADYLSCKPFKLSLDSESQCYTFQNSENNSYFYAGWWDAEMSSNKCVWSIEKVDADGYFLLHFTGNPNDANCQTGFLGTNNVVDGQQLFSNQAHDDGRMLYFRLVAEDDVKEVTYNFKDEKGNLLASRTFDVISGGALPNALDYLSVPADLVTLTGAPTGNLESTYEYDIVVSLNNNFPFVPTTITNDNFAEGTNWYNLKIRNNDIKRIKAEGDDIKHNASYNNQDDLNQYFAFVGNAVSGFCIYNKNVGVSKSIKCDASAAGGNLDASFAIDGTPMELFKGSVDGYWQFAPVNRTKTDARMHDLDNSLGYWHDDNADTDAGSNIMIFEVKVDDPKVELVLNYNENGYSKEISMGEYLVGYDFNYALPYGVEKDHVFVPQDGRVKLTFPMFRFAASVDNIFQWYSMDIHGNEGTYPVYSEGTEIKVNYKANDKSKGPLYQEGHVPDASYMWAFVGNPWDGFKVINKVAGTGVSLYQKNDADEKVSLNAEGQVFKTHNSSQVANSICFKIDGRRYYPNHRGEYIQGWTSNDAGSSFRFYPVGGDMLIAGETMSAGKYYRIQSTSHKTFLGIDGYTLNMKNSTLATGNAGQLWKYVEEDGKAYLQNVYAGLYPQDVPSGGNKTTTIAANKSKAFTYAINNKSDNKVWNIYFGGTQINIEPNGNVNYWYGDNAHHHIYEVEVTDEALGALFAECYEANPFDAVANGYKKIDITEGAVVISPSEFDAPSVINERIEGLTIAGKATQESVHALFDNLNALADYKKAVAEHGDLLSVDYTPKAEWGTIILPINWAKPDGWERYSCSAIEGDVLDLRVFDGGTKNKPMIIKVNEDKQNKIHQFIGYSNGAATTNQTVGLLTGVLEDNTKVPAGSYVLARQKSTKKIGFFPVAEGADYGLEKYKCYLTLPVESARYNALFFEGGETAIENVEGAESAAKAVVYDLAGRRVQNAQKGVFIVNGKVVIK